MRQLSSFLWLNRFGVYYVRLRLPRWLRQLAPTAPADVRRSLKTRDPVTARVDALQAAAHWEKAVRELEDMSKKGIPPNQWAVTVNGITVEVERGPNDDPAELEHIAAGVTRQLFAMTSVAVAAAGAGSPQAGTTSRIAHASASLFDEVMEYGRDKVASGQFTVDTWTKSIEPALRAFRELISTQTRTVLWEGKEITVDDIRMREITVIKMDAFKADMLALPAHAGQSNRVARRANPFSASFKAALASGNEPSNPRTVQKKLEFVATFIRWAGPRNPDLPSPDALTRRLSVKAGDAESYRPFTQDDLRAIFESPTFPNAEFTWLYWIPLMALYTGARLGELAQLQATDFETRNGLLCVNITDKDSWKAGNAVSSEVVKRLKTKSSKRVVPLHHHLLDLGLQEYIDLVQLTSSDGFLFPELKPSVSKSKGPRASNIASQDAWSKKASRPLNDLLRTAGVGASREKVFHSFRATLNVRADEYGLNEGERSALLGQSGKTINERHYLRDRSPKRLEDFMAQLDFGLNIRRYRDGNAASLDALDVSDLLTDD